MLQLLFKILPYPLLRFYKKRAHAKLIQRATVKDEPELLFAQKMCSKEKMVLDIGANIGLYTKFLSPLCKKLIAVEPVSQSFESLKFIIKKFELNNVQPIKKAVSDSTGIAKMYIPVIDGRKNFYRASLEKNKPDVFDIEEVLRTTIDDEFMEFAENINFIKCDVEGHELSCIRGAKEFLRINKPAWLMEVSGNPDESRSDANELFSLMEKYGYKIFVANGEVLTERRKGELRINYFFIHKQNISIYCDFIRLT